MYLQRANLSVGQHEAKVHRDRTPRKAAGEPGLENVLAAALGKFERRNGVAVFFLRGGHPILYRFHTLVGPAFVVYGRIRREALRRRFGCAGICNLNVTLNWVWKLNRHGSFLSFALRISIGLTASIASGRRRWCAGIVRAFAGIGAGKDPARGPDVDHRGFDWHL